VHTYLASSKQLDSWWKFVDKQLQQGRQAYVITPRVADTVANDIRNSLNDELDQAATTLADSNTAGPENNWRFTDAPVASAEGTFSMLQSGPLAQWRIGLLHGRLDSETKDSVLQSFANHQLDILVSTTVVEVGIDVPNATVITILDADRLGLSQLHQLRGRISRGSYPGYACAVASTGCDGLDNERLKAFQKSNDGFELAEMDLRLRGPGDLLGTSQTGLPVMRIANIIEDADLLELARKVAAQILQADPELANPQLKRLVQQTLRRYGKSLQLGDVG
jgi:ATP-dependent DNA helicase RecG